METAAVMEALSLPEQSHIDTSGSRAIIRGTRIKVSQIASEVERKGMTADEVVEAHPHLTLGQVHAALAYFYDHQDVIRAEWAEALTTIATLQERYPNSPSVAKP